VPGNRQKIRKKFLKKSSKNPLAKPARLVHINAIDAVATTADGFRAVTERAGVAQG